MHVYFCMQNTLSILSLKHLCLCLKRMNDTIRDYEFAVECGNKLHVYNKNNFVGTKKSNKDTNK